MSASRGGFEAVLTDVLADLASAGLDLDPASGARLATLEGRELRIDVELPAPLASRVLTLAIRGGRLRCFAHGGDRPNAVLRGTAPDLAAWLIDPDSAAGSRLQIDGDSTVLTEFAALLRRLRPDVAPALGRVLGDELADSALGTMELALAALRSAVQGAGRAVRQGAADVFVDREGAARFLDELDDLRLRVDRLTARVNARERAGDPHGPSREEPAGPTP